MKKTSIRIILALVLSAALFGSCKKDKDEEPVGATKENLVGTYKLKSAVTKILTENYDAVDFLEECQKDDTYTLNADFSALYTDAGTKCDPQGGYQTNWELDGNYIEIDAEYAGNIKSFNGKILVIEASGTEAGITFTVTVTLEKQ